DFRQIRDELQQARAVKERARADLFQAGEKIKRIEAEQVQLNRIFNPDNLEHSAQRQRLNNLHEETEKQAELERENYSRLSQFERDKFTGFSQFSDPRQTVGQLSDSFPFLLLPVRIETRFKTLNIGGVE